MLALLRRPAFQATGLGAGEQPPRASDYTPFLSGRRCGRGERLRGFASRARQASTLQVLVPPRPHPAAVPPQKSRERLCKAERLLPSFSAKPGLHRQMQPTTKGRKHHEQFLRYALPKIWRRKQERHRGDALGSGNRRWHRCGRVRKRPA
jgi:hypothetical protein